MHETVSYWGRMPFSDSLWLENQGCSFRRAVLVPGFCGKSMPSGILGLKQFGKALGSAAITKAEHA